MMDLAPGRRLGDRFVLVRRLAEGAGSEAWLAEDTALERRVAIKIVAGERLEAGPAARLATELERVRGLPPGVAVEVLGLHRADGLAILEMEYMPGGDLGQFRGRPYGVFALALGDVARALEAVHAVGLVHRDLKCGNVLLDDDGHARLADFGVAALAGQAAGGGSPYNMSPQQLRGEPASAADDLYAFGVLIYELLSAHPPWYPDITPDRVLHEPVPPLLPRHPAPERLRRLALRLLAKSPAQRLATMAEVRAELAAALAEAPEESAVVLPAPAATVSPSQRRAWAVPAAALVLAAAAAAVFLWLPQRVGDGDGPGVAEEIAAAAQAEAERRQQAAADAASLEEARSAAEQARDALDAKLAALDARGAASWAVEDMAAARRQRAEGERQHQARAYPAARDAWQQGLAGLEALEARLPQLVAAAIQQGTAAIAAGRSQAAREAFERALAIEPESPAAKRGLARAATLDEVLALLDAAARDEQAGRLAQAEQGYRAALSRDAEAPGAREALARIAAARQGDAYAAAMSRGLAALADGRGEDARAALRQALALRPGSREAEEALAQVDLREKAAGLAAVERRALAAEREERWADAEQAWTEARRLEPTLVAAQEGLARTAPRVALDARMAVLLSSPERVWTPGGRAEARSVIEAVAAAAAPKTRLQRDAAQLAARVDAAEVPVRVALTSDGVTDVVINRVRRLGTFQSQEVELLPGRYAVVGTRQGYRDVRRELVVTPDGPPPAVSIRCEEPI
jgi:tetratricopeptide (TPR) repeat protein